MVAKKQSKLRKSKGRALEGLKDEAWNKESENEGNEEATNRAIWGTWNKPYDFTITVIGYILGIHNFWRFPYLCYKYGGAFFIPYLIVLIFLGIPMVFMELTIGQYFSVGPAEAFHQMAPILSSVSYLLAFNSMVNCYLYTMMISWSRFYSSESTSCYKGWETCNKKHFYSTPECYTAEEDDSCEDIDPVANFLRFRQEDKLFFNFGCRNAKDFCGTFGAGGKYHPNNRSCVFPGAQKSFHVYRRRTNAITEHFYGGIVGLEKKKEVLREKSMYNPNDSAVYKDGEIYVVNEKSHSGVNMKLYSLTTWLLLAIFLYEGLLSVSSITYLLTMFPFILLVIFTAKALSLTQAITGIEELTHNRNVLRDLANVNMWAEAIIQGVCTTGIGTGVLFTLATFNKFHHKFVFDAYFTLFLNFITSACACIICFCTIGHYINYYRIPVPFGEYIQPESEWSSIEFGYIVYTHFLTLIHDQPYAPFLFFFMASSFATDSALRLVQMALDRVVASFPCLGRRRFTGLLGICLLGFIALFPMTQNGGLIYFIEYEYFTLTFIGPFVTLVEVVSFGWIYDAREIARRAEVMCITSSKLFRWYLVASLKLISPALLLFSLLVKLVYHSRIRFNKRPTEWHLEIIGWVCTSIPILILIVNVAIRLITTPKRNWAKLVQPLKARERAASRRSSVAYVLKEAMLLPGSTEYGDLTSIDGKDEEWRQKQILRFHMIPNAPLNRKYNVSTQQTDDNGSDATMSMSSTSTVEGSPLKNEGKKRRYVDANSNESGGGAHQVGEVIATEENVKQEFWKTILLNVMEYFLDWPGRFDEVTEDEDTDDEAESLSSIEDHLEK